jgi:hypothetical protein
MKLTISKWRWIGSVLLVSAIAFGAMVLWFSGVELVRKDRVFRGKPESEWIKELKYNDDEQAKEWSKFGEDGIDVLLRGLESAQQPGERAYRRLYRNVPATPRSWMPNPKQDQTRGTRHCIVDRLCDVGEKSPRVVPVMIRTVREDESDHIRQSAIGFFITGSEDTLFENRLTPQQKTALLPGLISAVENRDSGTHNAAILLKFYPEEADTVAPILVKAMQNPTTSVRMHAADALNRIAPEIARKAGATEMLIQVANDPDNQVASRAVQALGRTTNQLDLAVPALVKCLEKSDTLVACQAVWSLEWAPKAFEAQADVITNALSKAASRSDNVGGYAKIALKRWQDRVKEK